ncbi:D-glycero-beta-D-manno-heptose 1-phosphate adenylyltransferase [Salibacteraceae bacterium]|nr:D-glycero-beta-D-manno-heptose 1-phosphate adenylyltransferase [Salibacteraceae bacterium]MDA9267617.1 D-glycero-beta-D-manno-heptose 1-phosphate adenylyltransferase [Salibacteraceae bacterium]
MNPGNPYSCIYSLQELITIRKNWTKSGERIVFTNGVFDLIHPGHILYLEEAAQLGTKLIIGLNSDSSAKTLNKGDHRPINDEIARAIVISALKSVDAVVLFDKSTPISLIEAIKPDTLVKGGDYSIDQIVGADIVIANGGQVKTLQFVEDYSTTAIEQKIQLALLKK